MGEYDDDDYNLFVVYGKIRSGTSLTMDIISNAGYKPADTTKWREEADIYEDMANVDNKKRGARGELTIFCGSGIHDPNKIAIAWIKDNNCQAIKICARFEEWFEYLSRFFTLKGIGLTRDEEDRKKSVKDLGQEGENYEKPKKTIVKPFKDDIGIKFENLVNQEPETINALADYLDTTPEIVKEPINPDISKYSE